MRTTFGSFGVVVLVSSTVALPWVTVGCSATEPADPQAATPTTEKVHTATTQTARVAILEIIELPDRSRNVGTNIPP